MIGGVQIYPVTEWWGIRVGKEADEVVQPSCLVPPVQARGRCYDLGWKQLRSSSFSNIMCPKEEARPEYTGWPGYGAITGHIPRWESQYREVQGAWDIIFTHGKKKNTVYIYHYIYTMNTCAAGDTEAKEVEQQACFHDHDQSITRISKITDLMLLYACVNCYYLKSFFSLFLWYHVSANGFRVGYTLLLSFINPSCLLYFVFQSHCGCVTSSTIFSHV